MGAAEEMREEIAVWNLTFTRHGPCDIKFHVETSVMKIYSQILIVEYRRAGEAAAVAMDMDDRR
jgi:hypothetical protein